MIKETYTQWYNNNIKKENILAPCLNDEKAFQFIKEYLLNDSFYAFNPKYEQANSEILHHILYKYSREYRKEYKKYIKRRNK